MKFVSLIAITASAVVAAGCAASTKEVTRAQHAEYACDHDAVVRAVAAEADKRALHIIGIDDPGSRVESLAVDAAGESATEAGDVSPVPVRAPDWRLAMRVVIARRGDGWGVVVEPRLVAWSSGGSLRGELTPADADWPAWADGKADSLVAGVYDRLLPCVAD
jgi:hypothetical protein